MAAAVGAKNKTSVAANLLFFVVICVFQEGPRPENITMWGHKFVTDTAAAQNRASCQLVIRDFFNTEKPGAASCLMRFTQHQRIHHTLALTLVSGYQQLVAVTPCAEGAFCHLTALRGTVRCCEMLPLA